MVNVADAVRVAPFVGIEDDGGAGLHAHVPGHEGRRYKVRVMRENGGFRTLCLRDGTRNCKGAVSGVCYHQLAAVIALGAKSGHRVTVAQQRAELAGRVFPIWSKQSGKLAWGAVQDSKVDFEDASWDTLEEWVEVLQGDAKRHAETLIEAGVEEQVGRDALRALLKLYPNQPLLRRWESKMSIWLLNPKGREL